MKYRKVILKCFSCDSVLDDSLDSELESLRKALLESRLDSTPPKTKSKSPSIILNFLPKDKEISLL